MQHEIHTFLGGMSVHTMRLMVVEDEFLHLEIIKKLLTKLGFDKQKISFFSEAKSALNQVIENKFDLVLTDGNLPGMNGIEFVQNLLRIFQRKAYSIPIIMLTSNRELEYVVRAKTAGVDQFIAKPFSIQTLREKIEVAFEERRPVILADREVGTKQVKNPA